MTITLTVAGRIATVDATTHVVAGNTYPVALSLDSEWTGSLYLRVRFGSLYYDIPFASSATSVDVQMPVGYPEVGIGVFSEALEICTNEARVRLLRSILEAGEQVVEFDSDLYDQWAGEVTTLLTDDAFDAESTRPVQNAVLTAWKNTVPLDSALVHKTGNESIAGLKTFTDNLTVARASEPILNLKSGIVYSTEGFRSEVTTTDMKDGAETRLTQVISRVQPTSSQYDVRVFKPDRSGFYDMDLRSYSDHFAILVPTHYPTDSGGNPQPLTANALMASGNIAVDPRIVHTSGIETIAGAKTFTSLLTASNVQVKDASTPTVTMLKGSTEVANLASDGTQAGLTASSQFFGLRGLGTAPFGQAPSYTADNSADGKIVTRSMLATTPTVVHTTGNETVAGTKTLSGTVNANGALVVNGDLNTGYVKSSVPSIQQNKWIELAIITDMVEGLFYVTFSDPTNYRHEIRGLVWILSRASQNMAIMRWIAGRCATPEDFAITTDPTNNLGHIWFRKTGVYGTPCLIRLAEQNYLNARTRVVNGTDTNNYDAIPIPEGGAVAYSTKEDWMS